MKGKVFSKWVPISLAVAAIASIFVDEASASDEVDRLLNSIQQLREQPADHAQAADDARQRLVSSIQQLEQFLAGGGSETANRWSQWLALATLKQELASSAPHFGALQSIEDRFYQNRLGLELPHFVAVRRELRAFRDASEYAAADSPQELYRQRLAELTECLARLDNRPAHEDAHRAASILAWLESLSPDGAALAGEARRRFCRTNALAQGSARLANLLLQRNIQERNYIAETILGSFTQGVAITHGRLFFGTVPNQDEATLQIRLQGQVTAPANVADRRRVSVYTSAYTSIDASKQVFMNDQGLRLARAAARSAANVEIQDVDARSRILERVAWRRANRMMPEAEELTSRRAESEAATKLDQQADAALSSVNNLFCQKIRSPLVRFNALPANMQFWTDATHVRLSLAQHNELQLAAAGTPPSLPASYDVAGCVHESMINNLCESLLGGRTIQDEAWLEMMHLLIGTPPRALWVHDRAERWSVRFARQQPLIARFDEDRLGLTLRLMEVRQGEHDFRQSVEIEARFTPHITRDGPTLVREGDLIVRLTGESEKDDQASLRAFLHRKFGAVFPPEVRFLGLAPPVGGTLGKLSLLETVEFRSAAGWLSLGYQLPSEQTVIARTATLSR